MSNALNVVYIMLHGMWGVGEQLKRSAQFLRDNGVFQVRTPTLPGHGDEPGSLSELGMRTYSDFLWEYIQPIRQTIRVYPIVVDGHSMSSLLALDACRYGANRVIMTSPFTGMGSLTWASRVALLRYLPAVAQGEPFRVTFDHARTLALSDLSLSHVEDTYRLFVDESGRAMRDILLRRRFFQLPWGRIRATPSLVIGGDADCVTSPQQQARWSRKTRSALHLTPGAGHFPHLGMRWEETMRAKLDWVRNSLE